MPSSFDADSFGWTINGWTDSHSNTGVIKDYDPTDTYAQMVELNPETGDFNQANIDYYWLTGGNPRPVQCTVNMKQIHFQVNSSFNVLRPSASITVTTSPAVSFYLQDHALFPGMHAGDSSTPGITFVPDTSFMSSFPGASIVFYQKLVNRTIGVRYNNSWMYDSGGDAYDSVGHLPYDIYYNGSPNIQDSPGVKFPPVGDAESISDEFKTYLMFKPGGNESIYVPLKQTAWDWWSYAELSGGVWGITSYTSIYAYQSECYAEPEWTSGIPSDED